MGNKDMWPSYGGVISSIKYGQCKIQFSFFLNTRLSVCLSLSHIYICVCKRIRSKKETRSRYQVKTVLTSRFTDVENICSKNTPYKNKENVHEFVNINLSKIISLVLVKKLECHYKFVQLSVKMAVTQWVFVWIGNYLSK